MIHPTEHDIGRLVLYRPFGGQTEEGRISSLAPEHRPPCVFVKFRGPTGELTRCDRLSWTVGFDQTPTHLARLETQTALQRYRELRFRSMFNPPRPAQGRFPYFLAPVRSL